MTPEQSRKLQEELDIPIEVPTDADANKIKDIAKQKIQDASKQIGKGKGNWIRAIAAHLLPKIDWKKALKDFIGKALSGSEDVLPSRRHVGRGEYITGERPKYDAIQNAVMAVDTSGSMGEEEISIILAEIAGIIAAKKVKKTRIVYFDDGLQGVDDVGNPPKFDLNKASGGGGTSFMEPLRFMNEEFKKGKMDLAVFCTDGFADLNLPRPKYVDKFVWVILDNPAFQAPWGKMVVFISTKDVK
jgi:predicted metal-dependent peptidase